MKRSGGCGYRRRRRRSVYFGLERKSWREMENRATYEETIGCLQAAASSAIEHAM